MIKLAANLSFLYQELPFLDRFEAAAGDGFKGVEYLFPYDWNAYELSKRLKDNGMEQVLFNLPPGDWDRGERGLASLSGRENEFLDTVRQALDYAAELNCQRLHVMSGLTDRSLDEGQQRQGFVQALNKALELSKPYGTTLLIEPINTDDMPGYFLNDFTLATEIISEIGSDRLGLQFDIYHCQKIHGNLTHYLLNLLPITQHIQIANPPSRNEPDAGEINYSYLFNRLIENRYSGWIGCEYKPSRKTSETLKWADKYLKPM
ncbi:MAG: hydroxypyruvate isomerase family protein [Sneathiella sp.]|nr:hydroxypyruvate isomerase family protein [Sneathiella sp.]